MVLSSYRIKTDPKVSSFAHAERGVMCWFRPCNRNPARRFGAWTARTAVDQFLQCRPLGFQFQNLPGEFLNLSLGNALEGRASGTRHRQTGQEFENLFERKTQPAPAADDHHSRHISLGVLSIARGASLGRRQETAPLVVANRFDIHVRARASSPVVIPNIVISLVPVADNLLKRHKFNCAQYTAGTMVRSQGVAGTEARAEGRDSLWITTAAGKTSRLDEPAVAPGAGDFLPRWAFATSPA